MPILFYIDVCYLVIKTTHWGGSLCHQKGSPAALYITWGQNTDSIAASRGDRSEKTDDKFTGSMPSSFCTNQKCVPVTMKIHCTVLHQPSGFSKMMWTTLSSSMILTSSTLPPPLRELSKWFQKMSSLNGKSSPTVTSTVLRASFSSSVRTLSRMRTHVDLVYYVN